MAEAAAPRLSVTVSQVDATPTSRATIRTHETLIDRPQASGGLDQGPMGGELLLAALGGCFMSNLIAAAAARRVPARALSVTVEGVLASAPPRFEAIELIVHAEGSDAATLDKLVEISERGCIVANTLAAAVSLKVRRG
jgi:putative redox protein